MDAFGEPVAESDAMTTTYRFQGLRGYATDPASGYVARSPYEYSPTCWVKSHNRRERPHALGRQIAILQLTAEP